MAPSLETGTVLCVEVDSLIASAGFASWTEVFDVNSLSTIWFLRLLLFYVFAIHFISDKNTVLDQSEYICIQVLADDTKQELL